MLNPKLVDRLLTALLGTFITLAVLSPLIWRSYQDRPLPVATVDLAALLREAEARLTKGVTGPLADSTRAQLQAQVAAFGQKLSVEVEKLSGECECVLVNKAALLGNGKVVDMTPILRERLQ